MYDDTEDKMTEAIVTSLVLLFLLSFVVVVVGCCVVCLVPKKIFQHTRGVQYFLFTFPLSPLSLFHYSWWWWWGAT